MSDAPSTISRGNVRNAWVLAVTLSPATVATNTSAEQTFTVTGLLLGDVVMVNKPTFQAGVAITGSRVSAAGVLAISFSNDSSTTTAAPTASEVYSIFVSRPENVASNVSTMTQIPT